MERWLKRAPGAPARTSIDALPDELLLAVFQLVPEVTSKLLGSAVELKSRGPVERVCRRWRSLALQLPARLTLDLAEVEDTDDLTEEAVTTAVELSLPHLRCRSVAALGVNGWTSCLAPEVPALLARAVYPELRSLDLGGSSLLHFTSALPLCRRLEQLTISIEDLEDDRLLCGHLCGLRCSLLRLELRLEGPIEGLQRMLSKYVQPAALTLRVDSVAAMMWLPQLQQCTVTLEENLQIAMLNSALEAGLAPRLHSLAVLDYRAPVQRHTVPLSLPGLLHLPQLEQLECSRSVPESVWCAPSHVTGLLLKNVDCIAAPSTVQCTGLRQLHVVACKLEGSAFPERLCTALGLLSNLAIMESDLASLPPAFSRLSSLRRLVIEDASIEPTSVEAFRRLPGLTALHLPHCRLEGLPDGPYLSGLRSLDLSGSNSQLVSPIPFAATAASGLQVLRIRWDAPPQDWWPDVQWKLRCFPALKLLRLEPAEIDLMAPRYFGPGPDLTHPYVDELRELIRSELPSCRLDMSGQILEYPESANWPDLKE